MSSASERTVRFSSAAERDVRRLDRSVQLVLADHLARIAQDPLSSGMSLGGRLQGYRRYRFRSGGHDYRIAYRILEKEIEVVAVGSRQHFYSRLERRIG